MYTYKELTEVMSVICLFIWRYPQLIKIFANKVENGSRPFGFANYYNAFKVFFNIDMQIIVSLAVKSGKREIVDLLLQYGITFTINVDDIKFALSKGKLESTKYFLSLPISIEGSHKYYYTGADEEVNELIYQKTHVIPTRLDLYFSIREGNLKSAEWIINKTGILPDLPDPYYYDHHYDYESVARWVMERNPSVVPNSTDILNVLSRGSRDLLLIYVTRSSKDVLTYVANNTCENGNIEWLRILLDLNIRPSSEGADYAAKHKHIEILDILMSLEPAILPSSAGLSQLIIHNMDDLAVKITNMDQSIIPSENALNHAVKTKMDGILSVFALRQPPILPNIKYILGYEHKYLRDIFIQVNKGWVPDDELLEFTVRERTFAEVMWLYNMRPLFRPSQRAVDLALNHNEYDTVKWALNLSPPVRPSQAAITKVVKTKTQIKIKALHALGLI